MKIVVTDPCYIFSEKEWIKYVRDNPNDNKLSEKLSKALREISGDKKAVVAPTKIGDWANAMRGEGIIEGDFAADSGMVCVVELTDKLFDYWAKNGSAVAPGCVARLEVPDSAFYELNLLGEATKVNIWADENKPFEKLVATSEDIWD